MKIKSIFANVFVVGYPIIIVLMLYSNHLLEKQIVRGQISYLQLIIFNVPYFFLLALFILFFFIMRIRFHLAAIGGGILIIILIQFFEILKFFSLELYLIVYSQPQISMYFFGTLVVLYVMMLYTYLKDKKLVL